MRTVDINPKKVNAILAVIFGEIYSIRCRLDNKDINVYDADIFICECLKQVDTILENNE